MTADGKPGRRGFLTNRRFAELLCDTRSRPNTDKAKGAPRPIAQPSADRSSLSTIPTRPEAQAAIR
jgi:hypothetical protein